MTERMRVEVIYCEPGTETVRVFEIDEGLTLSQFLPQISRSDGFAHLDVTLERLGVWGRRVDGDTRLQPGDRVEIYRELQADAKTARRRRAAQQAGKPR